MMNPNDIDMEGIYNAFFDKVTGVAIMRYFKAQIMVHDDEGHERAINRAL